MRRSRQFASSTRRGQRTSARLMLAMTLVFTSLMGLALSALIPDALFGAIGVCALSIVTIPWLLQRRLKWTTPWTMIMLSVFVGATCTGVCVSLRWPDPDVIESSFRLGEEPAYFLFPSFVFLAGLAALSFGYFVRARPGQRGHAPVAEAAPTSGLQSKYVYIVVGVLLIISLWATRTWIINTGGFASSAISSKRTLVIDMQKDYNQHGPLLELAKLGQFGFFILLGHITYRRRQASLIELLLLAVLFLSAAAVPFIGSRRQPIMWLFLGAIVLLQHSPRRLSPPQFVVLIGAALMVFQFMTMIRGKEEITEAVSAKVGIDKLVRSVILNQNMADITKTAHVINEVGQTLEIKRGHTFLVWFLTPIPRSVWPEKPIIQKYCLEVGHDIYGMRFSGIPPGLIAEMYWNFKLTGVVLGGFLFGLFLRFLSDNFGIGRSGSLPAILIHIVGPMRMGFDAIGHSLGYGFFVSSLNTVVMLVLLHFMGVGRQRAHRQRQITPRSTSGQSSMARLKPVPAR